MDDCTRRSFMKGGALALFALGGPPRFLARAAFAQGSAAGPKILIAVFQRGAVDGLSMIVPHGDPDYYAARGNIAIARPAPGVADATVDLNGFFGLHPALAPPGRSGTIDDSPSCTRAAHPTPPAPTSMPRTTWSRGLPA